MGDNRKKILAMSKKAEVTTDAEKAALLLQTGEWVAVNAAFRGDEIEWCLIKIR